MRGHDGKLINPGARAKKFATQLRKKKVRGKKITKTQAVYRMAYLTSRQDSADWWKFKQKR